MTKQHSKQGGQCNHSFELGNVAGLPEEVLFICPKCGTPQEGEITSKPQQQESWKLRILDRLVKLGNLLHYKYGRNAVIPDEWSRDLYKDIGSIISTDRAGKKGKR